MPVPILLFGAATIMGLVFAPPSIIVTGPIIWLLWRGHRNVVKQQRQAATDAEYDARCAAAMSVCRSVM